MAGKNSYEVLCANFHGAVPGLRTVKSKLSRYDRSVPEGVVNVKYLKDFLIQNNLPLIVSISEDCTAIVSQRNYDSASNSVMGVSLPMEANGLRNHRRAVVTDIKSIVDVFEEFPRATLVLVVMAQPLVDSIPPIRILSFCTDNKFTAEDVKARMHSIITALAAEGILALVCSADGDAREMKFMRETEELGLPVPNSIPVGQETLYSLKKSYFYFAAIKIGCGISVQDPIHLVAKLRMRLIRSEKFIAIGNYIASPVHLQTLMNQYDKSRHLLKPEDLNAHDKMNYGSAERLCQPHVSQLLQHVEGSEATKFYLRLMNYSASSFLDKNLSPLDRVYRMWYVVFSLRLWRYWITCDKAYTLAANFMTLNVYLCAEFNAHALVLIVLALKDKPEAFKPWLCTSQPCESYFRGGRSCTTNCSTMVNFTAREFFKYRCRKIDATIRLTSDGVKDGLSYPRFERPFDQPTNQRVWEMPSMAEMDCKIRVALADAEKDLKKLGLRVSGKDKEDVFSREAQENNLEEGDRDYEFDTLGAVMNGTFRDLSKTHPVHDNIKNTAFATLVRPDGHTQKRQERNIVGIGQAIVLPKSISAPLLLGLAITLQHSLGSRQLIDLLHPLGFCSSYGDVVDFERNSAFEINTDLEGYSPQLSGQHIADNADHNISTIDEKETFHGMEIMAAMCPAPFVRKKAIPWNQKITNEDILNTGKIPIISYRGDNKVWIINFRKFVVH
ncbi:hypothetical protein DAPPUDRAFT_328025 [Daphnia pulex]|uniref:Uncharacterized protein n=1 Tax=Daphnia pulex TaxID=6669 RepID=E9HCJ8_DAPPU|nr:hypothetical protein DAPPUDRAFT_328025 [Daphnia pulex]|eukprot:EFX70567.1 hypothetical protein DAPPUDRAFT_328025 [Daphnia pulex]